MNKKILFAAVAIAIVAGGYFTYTSNSNTQDLNSMTPAAGEEAPAAAPAAEAAAPAVEEVAAPAEAAPAAEAAAPAAMACDFAAHVGKPAAEVEAELAKTGRPVRVIKEGDAVTMDAVEGRINIKTDANAVVTEITCG